MTFEEWKESQDQTLPWLHKPVARQIYDGLACSKAAPAPAPAAKPARPTGQPYPPLATLIDALAEGFAKSIKARLSEERKHLDAELLKRDAEIAQLRGELELLRTELDTINRVKALRGDALRQIEQHDAVLARIDQRLAALADDRGLRLPASLQ
jgi:hypothetical protein